MEIAEQVEKIAAALDRARRRLHVEGEGFEAEERDEDEAQPDPEVLGEREELLRVVGEEISEEDGRAPDDGDERPGGRSVSGPLGQGGRDEDVGRDDEQEEPKLLHPPPPDLDQAEEAEEIDGRREQQPVALVEEIAQERVDPEAKGDARQQFFQEAGGLFPVHGALPGHRSRVERAVDRGLEQEIQAEVDDGRREEPDDVPGRAVLPGHDPEAVEEERGEDEEILEGVEPDEGRDEEPEADEDRTADLFREAEDPEGREREQRDDDLRIDVDRVEEDRRREREEEPKEQRDPVFAELAQGVEVHLEAEQGPEEAQSEADDAG